MNYGRKGSWVEVVNKVPFRSCFLYWDTDEYYCDDELIKAGVKVRFKGEFISKITEKSPFRGILITCWTRDNEKIKEILTKLDKRLIIIEPEYDRFLSEWSQGLEEMTKEPPHDKTV